MKLSTKYSDILFQIASSTTSDEASKDTETFLKLVKIRGHAKLLPNILKEFDQKVAQSEKKSVSTLEVSKDADVSEAKKTLEADGNDLTEIEIVIDERLIGGFQYEKDDLVIDSSYKKSLLNLYRKITT